MNMPNITLVVATDKNNAIGINNTLPWKVPSELSLFKQYTKNKLLICGKNTFVSLPFILPDRDMIVLSSKDETKNIMSEKLDNFKNKFPEKEIPFLALANTFDSLVDFLLNLEKNYDEICVIGGGQIYELFYPIADKIRHTIINCEIDNADVFFDLPNSNYWLLKNKNNYEQQKNDQYSFCIYELIKKKSANIVSIKTKKQLSKEEIIKIRLNLDG